MTDLIRRLKHEGFNSLAGLDSGWVDPANVDDQRLHCVVAVFPVTAGENMKPEDMTPRMAL
jgi:hypothetical protein